MSLSLIQSRACEARAAPPIWFKGTVAKGAYMRLESFTVSNYRSINDSGEVKVSRVTALLGRNESGKSNLLKALESLNPAGGIKTLNSTKDFPRDRKLSDCTDDTQVLDSRWELNDDDRDALAEVFPRAASATHATVNRRYGTTRYIGFEGLLPLEFNATEAKQSVKKIAAAARAAADKLDDGPKAALTTAADTFEAQSSSKKFSLTFAEELSSAIKAFRKALAGADAELTAKQDEVLDALDSSCDSVINDNDESAAGRKWLSSNLPIFVLIDEYPELPGKQNIAQYLHRKQQGQLTDEDRCFEKLCKVADLDPAKLQQLLSKADAETRNQLVNRAGALVTKEIRRLWKDRALKVRFNIDGDYFETLVSDPNAVYEVEVNLEDRSRGFQWFFAFYIVFAADTQGGSADDAILLLDEPGLYLHARSQGDLLKHFRDDFSNQIIYSTHSPFMVPTNDLDSVRTVSITEDSGTTVSNDPSGDARTLFPLQAALGYDLAQSLFVGPNNLVVEGVTDYWYLSSVGSHFADSALPTLNPEITMTPAGGAQKVSYMVALLTSEDLNVLVLLDSEKDAKSTKDELVKNKLIAQQNVLFVGESFPTAPTEADIEDMLDPVVFEQLVRESYAAELKGKKLVLNASIPRIVKRFEAAFFDLGIPFHKTRPARLFLKKMAAEPEKVLPQESTDRFAALFKLVNERLDKSSAKGSKPFNS